MMKERKAKMLSNKEYADLIAKNVDDQLSIYPWKDGEGNRYFIKDQHFINLSKPDMKIGKYQITIDEEVRIDVYLKCNHGSVIDLQIRRMVEIISIQAQLFYYWHYMINNNHNDFGKELARLMKIYQSKDYLKYKKELAEALVGIRESDSKHKAPFLDVLKAIKESTDDLTDLFVKYEQKGMQIVKTMALYRQKFDETLTINSLSSESKISKETLNKMLIGNWAYEEDYQKVNDTLKLLLDEK